MSPKAQLALVRPPSDLELSALTAERRTHERLTLSSLSWLNEVRLKYGPSVSLIDLSSGGAQIETINHRLEPGRTVVIENAGEQGDIPVQSRVLRCGVTGIMPNITYRGALEFRRPIELPNPATLPTDADANPLHEHARLTSALRRAARTHASDGVTAADTATLLALREMIESSSRRAGVPYARALSRLMRGITRSLDSGACPEALPTEIAEQVRRAVPARSIRLADPYASIVVPSDTLSFDIPAAAGNATQLLVEFPHDCRIEDWHVQLLKTAAHLIAAHQQTARATERSTVERARRDESPADPHGWHRLVVRYKDGRLLKGFGRDFHPPKGEVYLWPAVDAPNESRITIRLIHLKAVFFVHDFDGGSREELEADAMTGRRIIVTFLDGEVLDATTLNYGADAPGFFVSPTDTATNNERIFVVNDAVRHVQFP